MSQPLDVDYILNILVFMKLLTKSNTPSSEETLYTFSPFAGIYVLDRHLATDFRPGFYCLESKCPARYVLIPVDTRMHMETRMYTLPVPWDSENED